jgi:hypothetical protein
LASQITIGLHRTLEVNRVIQLDESGAPPQGSVICFGSRSIGKGGTLLTPVCAILSGDVSGDFMLQSGDVLLRSTIDLRTERPLSLAATVTGDVLPATFDQSCIRVRLRSDVSPDAAELVVSYLNSVHVKHWFIANGIQELDAAALRRLEVPDPSTVLLLELRTLAEAEQQYRTWADEAAAARRGMFAAKSFAEQIPLLSARHRTEMNRLLAARDAGRFDYRVRNHYPHPLALRHEQILQANSGKRKIDEVLDCAEHLITWLAVMAILQDQDPSARGPVLQLLGSYCRSGALHLDWGKCVALLRAGAIFTMNHSKRLTLRFPELAAFSVQIADELSVWS